MLVNLITGRAGDSLISGDRWFHFRRGVYRADPVNLLARKRGYHAEPSSERPVIQPGTRWSPLNNCMVRMDATVVIAAVAALISLLTFISSQWQMKRKASNGYVERVEGRLQRECTKLETELRDCREECRACNRRVEELTKEKMALLERLVKHES